MENNTLPSEVIKLLKQVSDLLSESKDGTIEALIRQKTILILKKYSK